MNKMLIGVTSQNFRTVTGHAGKTRRFLIFSGDAHGHWQEVERLDLPKEMSMHEFCGGAHPVDELDILITAGCGEGFQHKMAERGVRVIATSERDPLAAVKAAGRGDALPPPVPHQH